jgi:hypothetical protein
MEWIPVSEKMPLPGQLVYLAIVSNQRATYGWLSYNHWSVIGGSWDLGAVTHWMPMPEPEMPEMPDVPWKINQQ